MGIGHVSGALWPHLGLSGRECVGLYYSDLFVLDKACMIRA